MAFRFGIQSRGNYGLSVARSYRFSLRATLSLLLLALSSLSASAQSYNVQWDRNTDAATTGYRLYYGTAPGTYSTSVDVGNAVTHPVTLTPATTYYFTVRAYNAEAALSPAATETSFTTPTSAPQPPTASFTGTLAGSGTASLSWQTTNASSVSINGVPVAVSGSVSYSITATTTYTLIATGAGGTVTRTATVAVPVVNCQMSAWTYSSATAWSACTAGQRTRTETWTRTITTQPSGGGDACGPTSEPRVVTQSCTMPAPTAQISSSQGSSAGTVVVTWQSTNGTSATINGSPVALSGTQQFTVSQPTTYNLSVTGAGGSTSAATTVTPRIDCAMTGWSFQSATAWGACSAGQRARTETWARSVVTSPMGGGAACGPTQEQRTVSEPCAMAPTASISAVAGPTTGNATVTWQTTGASGATINGAAVALSGTQQMPISATTTFRLVATGPGGTANASSTVTVTPVDCVMSDWSFRDAEPWGACDGGTQSRGETWVRSIVTPPAYGGAACGASTERRTVSQSCTSAPTAPGVPNAFRVGMAGQNVTLSWTAPVSGGTPKGYRLWVGTGGIWQIANGVATDGTRISGRLPNGNYSARITAFNDVGSSDASDILSFRVGAKARPHAPAGFTAALQNQVAVLSWVAPASDVEDTPTGYVIEVGSAPGLSNLVVLRVGEVSSFQAPVDAGRYFVRLRAVNEAGISEPSEERVLQVGAGPDAPLALASSGDGNVIALTWQPPTSGVVPAAYVIEAGSAPGLANLAVLRAGDATSFTTTAPAGVYYVRVRGVGADGVAGEASNEIVVRR
ncbi:MAG: fibronectin type III domain-containing protein [Acidobacteria bacterium]|nr:fibronectin type III domain-containing protein [Acidobacteriota bacterium]